MTEKDVNIEDINKINFNRNKDRNIVNIEEYGVNINSFGEFVFDDEVSIVEDSIKDTEGFEKYYEELYDDEDTIEILVSYGIV